MKAWWPLVVALVIPGGSVIALAVYLRRRWIARDAAQIAALIQPPRQTFEQLPPRLVEEVRAAAAHRRSVAEARRAEGAQIASGKELERRIRIVGGHK